MLYFGVCFFLYFIKLSAKNVVKYGKYSPAKFNDNSMYICITHWKSYHLS